MNQTVGRTCVSIRDLLGAPLDPDTHHGRRRRARFPHFQEANRYSMARATRRMFRFRTEDRYPTVSRLLARTTATGQVHLRWHRTQTGSTAGRQFQLHSHGRVQSGSVQQHESARRLLASLLLRKASVYRASLTSRHSCQARRRTRITTGESNRRQRGASDASQVVQPTIFKYILRTDICYIE
jgi:hypothetical protein